MRHLGLIFFVLLAFFVGAWAETKYPSVNLAGKLGL